MLSCASSFWIDPCTPQHMPRRKLIRSDFYPYHVVARTNRRELFPAPLSEIWKIFTLECLSIHIRCEAEIHAFVLMPNHFHMLITTPSLDLGQTMQFFMKNVTADIGALNAPAGRVFGGRYHWSLINSSSYFHNVLKYVYRNPVRGGLCDRVEDYPWSTYAGLIGNVHLPFPISFTRAGMEHRLPAELPIDWMEWLNRPFAGESEKWIQEGLKKTLFCPPIDLKTRKQVKVMG